MSMRGGGGRSLVSPSRAQVRGAAGDGGRAVTRSPASLLGNHTAQRLLVQAKLRGGTRGDRYEREADDVAGEVMRSLTGGLTAAGAMLAERAPAPRVQRCAEGGDLCHECAEEHEEAAPASRVQRQAREAEPSAAAEALLVPDEGPAPAPEQMRKAPFLALLRTAVCAAADEELARAERSTQGCPYLDYWFGLFERRDASHLERVIRRYAPEVRAARAAEEYVDPVVARVRRGVAVWAETGRVTGVSADLSALSSGGENEAEPAVQLKERPGAGRTASDPVAIRSRLGAGRSLDAGVRSRMESAFGADFSGVRVHSDASATQLSGGLHARAFTVGEHVAFDAGEYCPGTLVGDALIAHELAHVVQQGAAARARSEDDVDAAWDRGAASHDALETDADRSTLGAVAALWRGARGTLGRLARDAAPRLRAGPRLQRCDDRKKYCPPGKKWEAMAAPAGLGSIGCICRWHCVPAPEPVTPISGETSEFRCVGRCQPPRYAEEGEVIETKGTRKESTEVESPTSTSLGAHMTPLSGSTCGCIPPSDIAGAGASDSPLLQPGFEATDIFPHAGAELGKGTTTDLPPVERNRVVIEGPAVAGQKARAKVAPVERPVEHTAKPAGVEAPKTVTPPKQAGAPPPALVVKPPSPAAGGPAPVPLEQDPGARLVWGTRRSQIFHEEGSAHYEQMRREKFPNEKGRLMTAKEAEAAGYRPAETSAGLEAARRGVAEHAMVKEAMRPFEGKTLESGWQVLAVERTVGGKKRVDELWLDDGVKTGSGMKRIFVVDTYTGKVEPPEHRQKGWDYAKEPQIKAYIDQGYMYDYSPAIKHPEMLH
jgi:hypothetical protein